MPDPVVHVIDDDDAARESLEFLLRSANFEVTTYDSGAAFLRSLPQAPFGCIVTDVRMPDLTGIELLRRLKDLNVKMPVIVMTGHGDVPIAVEAMKLGAADFFEKPFDGDMMVAALRSVFTESSKDADREAERKELHDRLATLTPRERDVLKGLVAGNSNKIIAYDLGISPRTVEIYRANVMTKMEAASLSDLVRMALIGGILDATPASESRKSR
jgi:two-component system, LuxR family, response regulator FixJ